MPSANMFARMGLHALLQGTIAKRDIGVLKDGALLPFEVDNGDPIIAQGNVFFTQGVGPVSLRAKQEVDERAWLLGIAPRLEFLMARLELQRGGLALADAHLVLFAILNQLLVAALQGE